MCTKSGTIVKREGTKYSFFKMRCKSWLCDECAPMRRRSLIAEIKKGNPDRFVTLTVNPHWFDSPEERAAALAKAWRLTVMAFKYRWPNAKVAYFCIFEATKLGEPHLHIAWRGPFIPQSWLSKQMRQRMGAPVVDVRKIRQKKQVAEYVSKYISKRSIKFGTCKRYWRSLSYLLKSRRQEIQERNAGCTFWRSDRHLVDFFAVLWRKGRVCTWNGPDKFECEQPWYIEAPPFSFISDGITVQPKTV